MAIIQWALAHQVNPVRSPCNNAGAFTVTATLVVQTDAGGLKYVVRVCDWDGVGGQVLDATVITTLRGAAWHIAQHTFSLDCDAQCKVKGARGNSNEQIAEIYCNAEEQATILFAWEVDSWPSTQVACIQCDDEEQSESGEGGQSQAPRYADARRYRAVRLAWGRRTSRPVETVKVCLPAHVPPHQIIPDEIDFKVIPLQIGNMGERFPGPLAVEWKLSKRLEQRLTKLDGHFLRFEAKSHRWEIVKNVRLRRGTLAFKTDRGGLFGIAADRRYRRYDRFVTHPRLKGSPLRERAR